MNIKSDNFLFACCSTNLKDLIQTLLEEIKAIATDVFEFEYRIKSTLIVFLEVSVYRDYDAKIGQQISSMDFCSISLKDSFGTPIEKIKFVYIEGFEIG